jgi:hypothetical protein
VAGDSLTNGQAPAVGEIHAAGKHVIVIGGGDTGSDCVGTANRQGAASVTQFELLPTPPTSRPDHQPWPMMPMVLKTTSSHEEGAERHWSIMTTEFVGDGGAGLAGDSGPVQARLTELRSINVEQNDDGGFTRLANAACIEQGQGHRCAEKELGTGRLHDRSPWCSAEGLIGRRGVCGAGSGLSAFTDV